MYSLILKESFKILIFRLVGVLVGVLFVSICIFLFAVELRKTAIRLYQYLSLAQLLAAVGSLVCSGLALKYGLEVRYGVPYYSGGFIIGTLVRF